MSNKTEIVVRWASYRKVFSAISGEGVFQHPQAISLIDLGMMSEMEIFHHLTSRQRPNQRSSEQSEDLF